MSDTEDTGMERPQKRQKRFTFKRFAQRVEEVLAAAACNAVNEHVCA